MDTVTVTRGTGKLSRLVKVRNHELISDILAREGGEDLGPSPHELLAAALATCTASTLQLYANRKGWTLTDAEVSVVITGAPEQSHFLRKINLVGVTDAEQVKRLLEIADRCPVHRVLTGKIAISTELLK